MKKSEKKLTIHDVAKAAGVSVKTVSRIINDDPSVRERNREKVLKAIAQIGYQPDINARRLRTRQSYLIALLYATYDSNSYSSRLISGAIAGCDKAGYDLLVRPFSVGTDTDFAGMIRHIQQRSNPDGFIVAPPLCDAEELINTIRELEKPLVRIAPLDIHDDDSIFANEVEGTQEAIRYLLSIGHSRIGVVSNLRGHGGIWRLEGFRNTLREADVELDESLIVHIQGDERSLEAGVRKLLKRSDRPTAVFCATDFLATLVYRIARQMQLQIPFDISVVGFDDDPISKNVWPPLTTVRQPIANLGQAAAEKLIYSQIQDKPVPTDLNLQCRFILRSSCVPVL